MIGDKRAVLDAGKGSNPTASANPDVAAYHHAFS
jgi:hypothetical protein